MKKQTRAPRTDRKETSKKVITHIASESLRSDNRTISNAHLAIITRQTLVDRGEIAQEGSPSEDTIRRMIGDYRKKDPADQPWSMGASDQHNLTAEANKDLIEIWRRCFALGIPFTIRQAGWVVKLRNIVPFEMLLFFATEYSIRERVSIVLNKAPADTTDLDAMIAFGEYGESGNYWSTWPFWTAFNSGVMASASSNSMEKILKESDVIERSYQTDVAFEALSGLLMFTAERLMLPNEPKVRHSIGLTDNAQFVYAMWLQCINRVALKSNKSDEWKVEMAQSLYDEIEDIQSEFDAVDLIDEARSAIYDWWPGKRRQEKLQQERDRLTGERDRAKRELEQTEKDAPSEENTDILERTARAHKIVSQKWQESGLANWTLDMIEDALRDTDILTPSELAQEIQRTWQSLRGES